LPEQIVVKVELIGILRGAAGKSRMRLSLKERSTVRELVEELTARLGQGFREALIDSELGDPRPNALILVNRREIGTLQNLETILHDGDTVTLVPVTHGGRG
jgi:molybdopterin converting factor small subunit